MESPEKIGQNPDSHSEKNFKSVQKEIDAINKKIQTAERAIATLIKRGEYGSAEAENQRTLIKSLKRNLEELLDSRYLLYKKRDGVEGVDEIKIATTRDKNTKMEN